jgi:hypothetical protein
VGEGSALSFEVGEGLGMVGEEGGELFKALFVVFVEVGQHVWGEEGGLDQFSAVGGHGQVFEAVEVFESLVLLDHDYVFDSDSEFAIVVVAWLVRDAHTDFKFYA